jgi:hypothetical protein
LDIYPYLSLAKDISPCNDKIITGIILNTVTVPSSKIKQHCRQLQEE